MILGLILARAGSKGIPNKNLQIVGDKTLIERSVEAALNGGLEKVVVYSDGDEILSTADHAGAVSVLRPQEISGDNITSEATVKYFIQNNGITDDIDIMLLQCTTPFLYSSDVKRAIDLFYDPILKYDSIVSVTQFNHFILYRGGYGSLIPIYPVRWLRQDRKPLFYMENGAFYLAKHQLWLNERRIGNKCGCVEMEWWRSIEVDDPDDLYVARQISGLFSTSEVNYAMQHKEKEKEEIS